MRVEIGGWRLTTSVLLLFVLMQVGCGESPKQVEQKILLNPNQTCLTIKLPINKLRDTLVEIFDIDHQEDNKILGRIFFYKSDPKDLGVHQITFWPETSDTCTFGKEYFKKPNTKNDVFLTQYGEAWYSAMYFNKSKPFEFRTEFAIQLKELSKNSTLITAKALDPKILNGKKCCGPCLGNYSLEEKVQPTTVEEYTLILYIAEQLSIKGLPRLQLPK